MYLFQPRNAWTTQRIRQKRTTGETGQSSWIMCANSGSWSPTSWSPCKQPINRTTKPLLASVINRAILLASRSTYAYAKRPRLKGSHKVSANQEQKVSRYLQTKAQILPASAGINPRLLKCYICPYPSQNKDVTGLIESTTYKHA